jgi:hypothetical protein
MLGTSELPRREPTRRALRPAPLLADAATAECSAPCPLQRKSLHARSLETHKGVGHQTELPAGARMNIEDLRSRLGGGPLTYQPFCEGLAIIKLKEEHSL